MIDASVYSIQMNIILEQNEKQQIVRLLDKMVLNTFSDLFLGFFQTKHH